MAQPYPLYDELLKRVYARNEKTIDINRLCKTITNISFTLSQENTLDHYNEIQALIIHYDILSNGGVLVSPVPFDGKVMAGKKGILNYIINLPPLLQQIIAQYVDEYANPNSGLFSTN